MHKLRQAGREHTLPAHVWQAEFARQHEKLVVVTGKIGGLDKRILVLVEGVPTCHAITSGKIGKKENPAKAASVV